MAVIYKIINLLVEISLFILIIYGAASMSDDIIFFLSYGSMDIIRNSIMEVFNLMGHPL